MAAGPLHKRRITRQQEKAAQRARNVQVKTSPKKVDIGGKKPYEYQDFSIHVGGQKKSKGMLLYRKGKGTPTRIVVSDMSEKSVGQEYEQAHKRLAGKVHTTGQLKVALAHLKQRFPKAKFLTGPRITGMKGKLPDFSKPRRIHKETGTALDTSNVLRLPTPHGAKAIIGRLRRRATKGLLGVTAVLSAMGQKNGEH